MINLDKTNKLSQISNIHRLFDGHRTWYWTPSKIWKTWTQDHCLPWQMSSYAVSEMNLVSSPLALEHFGWIWIQHGPISGRIWNPWIFLSWKETSFLCETLLVSNRCGRIFYSWFPDHWILAWLELQSNHHHFGFHCYTNPRSSVSNCDCLSSWGVSTWQLVIYGKVFECNCLYWW